MTPLPRSLVISGYLLGSLLLAGAYGMILMLPLRIEELGGSEKDVGDLQLVVGLTAIATILMCGRIADRLGQLSTLALAAVSVAIGLVLFAEISSLGPLLYSASLWFGFGWGLFFALKLVVLARITTPTTRFRAYSYLAVAVMAGFGLWPVAGAAVVAHSGNVSTAFNLSAFLCLVSAGLYQMLRRPIRSLETAAAAPVRSALSFGHLLRIIQSPALAPVALTFISACVFSGMSSFQTVFAKAQGLDYAAYFLTYTCTVIAFRILLANRVRPETAYRAIAWLFLVMTASVFLFLFVDGEQTLYLLVAGLFGLGYGVASPIVQTMGANEARPELMSQTLQFLVLTHLAGVFGFPIIAGATLVAYGPFPLLTGLIGLSLAVCLIAAARHAATKPRLQYS